MASTKSRISSPYRLIPLYGDLIKIKQTFLLVFSGVFSWLISSWPEFTWQGILWISISLFLSVSGSTLLNMFIDRDIDAVMERTRNRALPSGRLNPVTVLSAGMLTSLAGIILSGLMINAITMLVIFLGVFIDVVVYSILMKRKTRFSIIFGGISGGMPVLAGRTAFTGNIDLIGLLMSFFVLCWIPMHILTLAMIPENLDNYRRAGVPMWPVVRSENETIRVITLSAFLSGLIIVAIAESMRVSHIFMSPVYALSAYMIILAAKNFRDSSLDRIFRLFKVASIFMALSFLWLFVARISGMH